MLPLVEVSIGDIVFKAEEAGRVCSCVREGGGRLLVLVELLTMVVALSEHATFYKPTEIVSVWRIECVEQSLAWRPSADGLLTMLR